MTYVRAQLDLTPKGQNDLKLEISAGAENFQNFDMPGMTQPVPTHLYAKGFVPKMAFDQTVDIKKAGSSQIEATWNGTMAIDTEKNGRQDWKVNVTNGVHELATLSFDSTTDSAPVIRYADGTADTLRLD